MRIVVVYREFSDHAREVEEWVREFEHRTGTSVEVLSPDTPDGELFCASRDILEFPVIAAVDTEGKTYGIWRGTPLPVIDEVIGYLA